MAALRAARDGATAVGAEITTREAAEAEQAAEVAAILAGVGAPAPDPEPTPTPDPGSAAAPPAPGPTPAPTPAPTGAAPTPPSTEPAPVTAAALPPLPLTPGPGGAVMLAPSRQVEPVRPAVSVVASADVPGFANGQELSLDDGFLSIATAIFERHRVMGQSGPNAPTEYLSCASIRANLPPERQLDRDNAAVNLNTIRSFTSHDAIVAAGGLCAPVNPYYEILTLAEASRPVRDALPVFEATREGASATFPRPSGRRPGSSPVSRRPTAPRPRLRRRRRHGRTTPPRPRPRRPTATMPPAASPRRRWGPAPWPTASPPTPTAGRRPGRDATPTGRR